jgi:hypothetical protein
VGDGSFGMDFGAIMEKIPRKFVFSPDLCYYICNVKLKKSVMEENYEDD